MAAKYLILFVIATVVTQGSTSIIPQSRSLVEITLADQFHTYIANPLISKTISIAKLPFDTLESCHVVYPNGALYEAFPTNSLPSGNIIFLEAVQPFTSCAVAFQGTDVSMSGTYELVSTVQHNAEDYRSMTRQRFHMTFVLSELWEQ